MPNKWLLSTDGKRRLEQLWAWYQQSRLTQTQPAPERPAPRAREIMIKAPAGGITARTKGTAVMGNTVCGVVRRDSSGTLYITRETVTVHNWAVEATASKGERLGIAAWHLGKSGVENGAWIIESDDCGDDSTTEAVLPSGVSNVSEFSSDFADAFDSPSYYSTGEGSGLGDSGTGLG